MGANPPPAEPPVEAGEAGETTSKKAAKKAEAKAKKEAEKARRAAERAAAQQAAQAAQAEDHAVDNYGSNPEARIDGDHINLKNLTEADIGKTVVLRAWIQNSRMQGAKVCSPSRKEKGTKHLTSI